MTGRGGTGKIGGLPWRAHPSIYTLVSGIYTARNHPVVVRPYTQDAAIQNIQLKYTWIRRLQGSSHQTTDELFMYPNKPMRYWSYQLGHELHDTPHKL